LIYDTTLVDVGLRLFVTTRVIGLPISSVDFFLRVSVNFSRVPFQCSFPSADDP